MADKILTELVINRGTKQKFDDLPTKSPDELYFITDTETFQRKLIAGTNITINESTNTISATGGETIKNQNASSSITKTYDWVGTLQEAIDQNVRALHPDWIIKITDDVSGGSDTMYTKTEVDTGFVAKGHEVIAFQAPTAANDYTWYRKYADGWVEQGGIKEAGPTTVNFPVTMANTDYWYIAKGNYNNTSGSYASSHDYVMTKNTTNMVLSTGGTSVCWQVNGMAA